MRCAFCLGQLIKSIAWFITYLGVNGIWKWVNLLHASNIAWCQAWFWNYRMCFFPPLFQLCNEVFFKWNWLLSPNKCDWIEQGISCSLKLKTLKSKMKEKKKKTRKLEISMSSVEVFNHTDVIFCLCINLTTTTWQIQHLGVLCYYQVFPNNHRMTEKLWLEGTLKPIQFQSPATGRVSMHYIRLPRAPVCFSTHFLKFASLCIYIC